MIKLPTFSESIVTVSCLKHIYPDTTESHICGLDFVGNRGERVAVIRQYQACREALQSELGVEPSPATEALYKRLAG